jgi:hypothetical protein
MAAVSENIVREYFELCGFLVRQRRKYIRQVRAEEEDEIDFFVLNPEPQVKSEPLPFVLSSSDLPFVERAVVVVKGWHTGSFTPGVLANAPEIFRFVEPKVFHQAARAFGKGGVPLKLLVVPTLPQDRTARDQSIALLHAKGIDGVIPFRTMLVDLVTAVEPNRNYQKSDLLQIIRILKNYDFFKGPQMELFKPKRKSSSRAK